MKDRTNKTFIILITAYIFILMITFFVSKKELGGIGMMGFLGSFVSFLIGAIICLDKKLRDIGRGVIIASLIIAVIGFSVCSANFNI